LAVLLLILCGGCAHKADLRASLQRAIPQSGPELLAVYQPWFGTPEHIGVGYSSQDRVVVQRQIEQARSLGMAGFLVNWYGPHKEFMDRSYALLQQLAAASEFHVAIQYDEAVYDRSHETEAVAADLQYAYDHYIGPGAGASRTAYLRYADHPMIFIFPKTHETDWDQIRRLTQSWDDPPLLIMKDINERYAEDFDGFYAWINPGDGGWQPDGSNWGGRYLEKFYSRMLSQYPDKIAVGAAWPGFNDKRAFWSRNRYMDGRCGRTFEDSLRAFRRYYTPEHPLAFLLLVTWNDYEEGTAIERGVDTCNGRTDAQRTAAVAPPDSHSR
jgi:hypothetical protein